MDSTLPYQSAVELLRQSRRPLLSIPNSASLDAVAAALALASALSANREVSIVAPGWNPPPSITSALNVSAITTKAPALRHFTISLATNRVKLESLSYDVDDNRVNIHLVPAQGFFTSDDISLPTAPFQYDAIIILGAKNLASLGEFHAQHHDFFYHTPLLNIDHQTDNERFGHVNLVDITASSASEIVTPLLRALDAPLPNQHQAHLLLTGLISATRGFQDHRLTPRALNVAADLMAAGAKRDDIVRKLYYTKTVPTLKAWGRVLSNLKTSKDGKIVWSSLSAQELQQLNVAANDIAPIADELMSAAEHATWAALFLETRPESTVVLMNPTEQALPTVPVNLHQDSARQYSGTLRGQFSAAQQQLLTALESTKKE